MAFGRKEDVIAELRARRDELSFDFAIKANLEKAWHVIDFIRALLVRQGAHSVEAQVRVRHLVLRYTFKLASIRIDKQQQQGVELMEKLKDSVRSGLFLYKFTILQEQSASANTWNLIARRPTDLAIEMDLAVEEYREALAELAASVRATHKYYRGKRCARR